MFALVKDIYLFDWINICVLNYLGTTRWATMAINCDWISKNATEMNENNIGRVSIRKSVDNEWRKRVVKRREKQIELMIMCVFVYVPEDCDLSKCDSINVPNTCVAGHKCKHTAAFNYLTQER